MGRLNWMQLVLTVVGAALAFTVDHAFFRRKKIVGNEG
jgi:hypothetical protein